jgi:antitoxin component YwqK of YwqJK toxin-antitoxin module
LNVNIISIIDNQCIILLLILNCNLCTEAIMKKWPIMLSLLSLGLSLKSQDIKDLEELNLDFSWDSKWAMRYDYQILSPRDSTLIGKLSKVSESFWQKEVYDVEGNWIDTYRFLKSEDGIVSISKGESIIDDRYYLNNHLQKRLLAKNGKLSLEWHFSYDSNNKLQRFSEKDSLLFVETIFIYDSLGRVEKAKKFSNGNLTSEEHYVYNQDGLLAQRYSLNSELDSISKTVNLFQEEETKESLSYKFAKDTWVLAESIAYEYSEQKELVSTTLLLYSEQGNCVHSQTNNYDSKQLIVSTEKMDLISGDWQLVRTYYKSADQGGIVLGEGR